MPKGIGLFLFLGHTDSTDSTDILYVTNFFGYENTLPIETIKEFKAKGAIILYDRTHSIKVT